MVDVNDFITGADGDLVIANGDLKIDESTLPHQHDLLLANKGEYRQHPTIGVGLNNEIDDNFDSVDFKKAVTQELENDGQRIVKIEAKDPEKIKIDSEYVSTESDSTR
jgi:hypothetical protein